MWKARDIYNYIFRTCAPTKQRQAYCAGEVPNDNLGDMKFAHYKLSVSKRLLPEAVLIVTSSKEAPAIHLLTVEVVLGKEITCVAENPGFAFCQAISAFYNWSQATVVRASQGQSGTNPHRKKVKACQVIGRSVKDIYSWKALQPACLACTKGHPDLAPWRLDRAARRVHPWAETCKEHKRYTKLANLPVLLSCGMMSKSRSSTFLSCA